MKIWCAGSVLVIAGGVSLGCAGLLGLDDKEFEGTGGGGTGGSNGTTTIATGGAGGTTALTTSSTATDGTGGAGGAGGGAPPGPVSDDFDFEATGEAAANALAAQGWMFTWRSPTKEPYAEFGPPEDVFPYPDLEGTNNQLVFGLPDTFHWVNGRKGVLMYKKISGDFLVVTDVFVEDQAQPTPGPPQDEQAGAGIMVRDPASALSTTGGQTWASIDRSARSGTTYVHGSWGRNYEAGSIGALAEQGGKVALCRLGGSLSVSFQDEAGTWQTRDDLLANLPFDFALPDEVQVGLFVYAFNWDLDTAKNLPSPNGVKGAFQHVRQIDPKGNCDPSFHEPIE